MGFASSAGFDPVSPQIHHVLQFLQQGLDLGFSSSTLKGQVSAISAFTDRQVFLDPLTVQFFKAVVRVQQLGCPQFHKWDLPLVLDFLALDQFMGDVSLWHLTLKTAFLVAITSARRVSELAVLGFKEPFTISLSDRVVLVPMFDFVLKVVSDFHLRQKIVLPAFTSVNSQLHRLDVGDTLKAYISATSTFGSSDQLFLIPTGARKGGSASITIIASWIVQAIALAYKWKALFQTVSQPIQLEAWLHPGRLPTRYP